MKLLLVCDLLPLSGSLSPVRHSPRLVAQHIHCQLMQGRIATFTTIPYCAQLIHMYNNAYNSHSIYM